MNYIEKHVRGIFLKGNLVSCQNVCLRCIECAEARMISSDKVPMQHLTAKTRERICRTIMTPVKKAKGNRSHKPCVPVFVAGKKPIATQDADSANVLTHEPITLEGACIFLPVYWIVYITSSPGERYSLPPATDLRGSVIARTKAVRFLLLPLSRSRQNITIPGVIDSDMHLLAEMLGVHIYEYRTDQSAPKWNYIAGNKHGQNGEEAIYLQYWLKLEGVHKGEGHVAIITGMRPKMS